MTAILITGGSRGIGRATALLAGSKKWAVTVNYIGDEAAARETVAAVIACGGRAVAVQGDVAVESDVTTLFEAARVAFGALDGIVINAGVVALPMGLADMSVDRLRRTFEVNVLGAYLCARQAVRDLSTDRGGRGGSIVVVSSAAARLGAPGEYVDYAGSKAALEALTVGLAKEVGRQGIRVNAVRPGIIDTDIHTSGGQPDRAERLGATTPLGRAGRPEEVAEAILWLLGDASSYTTGAILDVTGGR